MTPLSTFISALCLSPSSLFAGRRLGTASRHPKARLAEPAGLAARYPVTVM